MRFHVNARSRTTGEYLRSLGAFANAEQATRAAKFMRKWMPAFILIEISEDHAIGGAS